MPTPDMALLMSSFKAADMVEGVVGWKNEGVDLVAASKPAVPSLRVAGALPALRKK